MANDCTTYQNILNTLYFIIVNTLRFLHGFIHPVPKNEGTNDVIRSEYMHVRKYSRH